MRKEPSLPFTPKNIPGMFKKFTMTDKLMFLSATLSLVYSEVLFFQGDKQDAIFLGLWVPSILAFGMYLKMIKNTNND